jgi:hypothetical protein
VFRSGDGLGARFDLGQAKTKMADLAPVSIPTCPHQCATLSLEAKLFFSASVDETLKDGYGGADFALDSVEWCPMLHHNAALYVELGKWVAQTFPELDVKLNIDEKTEQNKNSCTVHLSWSIRNE